MRLFIAIELPAAGKEQLAAIAHPPLAALKWVSSAHLHVTLKFLGEVAEDDLPALKSALSAVPTSGGIRLTIDSLDLFPERGPARIVAARVEDPLQQLPRLVEGIESACSALGFAREDRPFRPHITLARAKPPVRRDRVMVTVPPLEFVAGEFVLMQSKLSSKGSTYSVVSRFPLSVG